IALSPLLLRRLARRLLQAVRRPLESRYQLGYIGRAGLSQSHISRPIKLRRRLLAWLLYLTPHRSSRFLVRLGQIKRHRRIVAIAIGRGRITPARRRQKPLPRLLIALLAEQFLPYPRSLPPRRYFNPLFLLPCRSLLSRGNSDKTRKNQPCRQNLP